MKKNLLPTFVIASLLFFGSAAVASAESTATPVETPDIVALQAKVNMLLQQIEMLKASMMEQKTAMKVMRDELQLMKKQLREGDTGDDVRILQETLATDPEIYPEGLITGKFGPLTAKAVRRFQEKHNLEGVGEVGPKTREILNRFLAEGGAGKSGKIPEGLLRNAGAVVVKLGTLNESGFSGVATIRDNEEGKAVVRIELHKGVGMMKTMGADGGISGDSMMKNPDMMSDDASVKHPAHIHVGACPTPGAVKYALSPVVGGKSETTLTVMTKDILAGLPLAINVHKSPTEASVFLACGDIAAPMMKGASSMMAQ